jgi:hypothetical protein
LIGSDDREASRLIERIESDENVPESTTFFCFDEIRDTYFAWIAMLEKSTTAK